MSEARYDLPSIMRDLEAALTEMRALRDDVAVLTAIATRRDGTLSALLTEVRAMYPRFQ